MTNNLTGPGAFSVPVSFERGRVLIIDDYPGTAEAIATLARLLQFDADIAHTGREALAKAYAMTSGMEPTHVLVDVKLPDMSGFEVARALRARPGGHRLFIAALSGWTDGMMRQKAIRAGCDVFLSKPIGAEKICQILAIRSAAARE